MPKTQLSSKERKQLLAAARRAIDHAYAPYSRFRVGAALLTTKGELFVGCNVENASYGITNCAERTAIFSAVAHSGRPEIRAIAVVNDQGVACSPCGACRQVIYEFGPRAVVLFPTEKGWKEASIRQLLPEGFRLRE
jgi:cytidine deaminase